MLQGLVKESFTDSKFIKKYLISNFLSKHSKLHRVSGHQNDGSIPDLPNRWSSSRGALANPVLVELKKINHHTLLSFASSSCWSRPQPCVVPVLTSRAPTPVTLLPSGLLRSLPSEATSTLPEPEEEDSVDTFSILPPDAWGSCESEIERKVELCNTLIFFQSFEKY